MDKRAILDLMETATSARSLQAEVGPSELGGCRRKVWHRLNGTRRTNETLTMAAWMGTAIHTALEQKVRASNHSDRYLIEVEVEENGLLGHVDLYDTHTNTVTDWKTTTKKNLRYFPSEQQRWQIQVYGYLLQANGYPVDIVRLVAIPRDGNETHVVIHSEDYSEGVALQAISWLRQIQQMDVKPEPEKARRFCQDYCEYFDASGEVGCPSVG